MTHQDINQVESAVNLSGPLHCVICFASNCSTPEYEVFMQQLYLATGDVCTLMQHASKCWVFPAASTPQQQCR